jgi:hypothetical protein
MSLIPGACAISRERIAASPCSGLSPPLSTMRDKTPQRYPVGFPPFLAPRLYRARAGASGASHVLRRLSSCMPRPEDSGGPAPPRPYGGAHVAFGSVKTLGVRNKRLFEAVPALQGARSPLRPPGYSVYASPILSAVSPRLRHGRKTRYGWMAHPYPTGTFTLQETPSFLGAITLGLRRAWQPQRGTSGGWKASPASRS